MLFTSYSFIAFMTIVFVLYYLVPKSCQWPLLLVFSYIFYFIADPRYLIFILVTTISTYLISLKMNQINMAQDKFIKEFKGNLSREQKKNYKSHMKHKKWIWLLICLFINIGILSVTNYTNFVIQNINDILHGVSGLHTVNMIVPMGISFYTFQTMGYIIDVYRGKQSVEKNFFKLALFVSFFPQLVQGPISRFHVQNWKLRWRLLRDTFLTDLGLRMPGEFYINGDSENYSSNIISLTIPGVNSESLLLLLDQLDIYLSAGSACSAASAKSSHVLRGIGMSDEDAACTVRISMGFDTTVNEMHEAAEAIVTASHKLKSMYS